jgi:hypothetical protein
MQGDSLKSQICANSKMPAKSFAELVEEQAQHPRDSIACLLLMRQWMLRAFREKNLRAQDFLSPWLIRRGRK